MTQSNGIEDAHTALIDRRVAKGNDRDRSTSLLAELLAAHSGENLVAALVYQGFATERAARTFVTARLTR